MRTLIRNTAINFGAFGIISVVGLVQVPILVGAYGLEEFGLLVLLRLMVPQGVMGILDMGLPDAATRYMASLSGKDGGAADRARQGSIATSLLLLSVFLSLIGLAFVYACSSWLTIDLFETSLGHQSGLIELLQWTAFSYLVLYPGMVGEGILKGFERFDLIRGVDVVLAVINLTLTVVFTQQGLSYESIGYLFLGLQLARAVMMLLLAAPRFRWRWPQLWSLREELRYAFATWQRKSLDHLSSQVPPLIIPILTGGPSGTGLYEALMRLPRFFVIAVTYANSALLPVSAKLDRDGEETILQLLVLRGTSFSFGLFLPILMGGVIFSEEIIVHWLGAEYIEHAPWMALAFVWPILRILTLFGEAVLTARREGLGALNRIYLGQTLAFLLGIPLTIYLLGTPGVILALVATQAAVTLPLLIRICHEYGLPSGLLLSRLARLILVGVVPGLLLFPFVWLGLTTQLVPFLLAYLGWSLAYWLAMYNLGLSNLDRIYARRTLESLLGFPLQRFSA
ncbi:lipopolysaccharide biosynthesis protein [Rhodovibrionaceae bacterium A322]